MRACAAVIRPSLTTRVEPKCQAQARQRWLAARERELLATSYFHVVFTVPHELNVLALDNARLFYDLLFTASAQTLLEIAANSVNRTQTNFLETLLFDYCRAQGIDADSAPDDDGEPGKAKRRK